MFLFTPLWSLTLIGILKAKHLKCPIGTMSGPELLRTKCKMLGDHDLFIY